MARNFEFQYTTLELFIIIIKIENLGKSSESSVSLTDKKSIFFFDKSFL